MTRTTTKFDLRFNRRAAMCNPDPPFSSFAPYPWRVNHPYADFGFYHWENFRPSNLPIRPILYTRNNSNNTQLFQQRRNFRRFGSQSRFPRKFYRRRRRIYPDDIPLNPSDPLNLKDFIRETERRRIEGLSPLRGDSRFNTPALSASGEMNISSPMVSADNLCRPQFRNYSNFNNRPYRHYTLPIRDRRFSGAIRRSRRLFRRLPTNGNFRDYYSRRDPRDRLQFLLPEWFSDKDVAEYGCHNGVVTFRILEEFHDVKTIDAFDCDRELIAIAKNMQKERLRWSSTNEVNYEKIHFQVSNWIECQNDNDIPTYDTIIAFSVIKWIHLNNGDEGLMRFFRKVFNLLKPGGQFLVEPQLKSSYTRKIFTAAQEKTFRSITINPSYLEPLLLDLGFSYFDTIKMPLSHEPFQRRIILCSKSYGVTPASIRDDCRDEASMWTTSSPLLFSLNIQPPPVNYHPQTPNFAPFTFQNFHSPNETISDPSNSQLELTSNIIDSPEVSTSTDAVISNITIVNEEYQLPDSTMHLE